MSHPGRGHGHSHNLSEIPAVLSPFARWFVIVTLSVIGVGVVIGAAVLWPSDSEHTIPMQFRSADGGSIQTVDAHVVDLQRADCLNPLTGTVQDSAVFQIEGAAPEGPCVAATAQIDSGDDTGRHTLLEIPTNRAQAGSGPGSVAPSAEQLDQPQAGQPSLTVGDKIRLAVVPGPDGNTRYTFFDFQRTVPTIIWALLFVAAVVLVAAWRGLRSIIGLVFAFLVLGVFTLPAILDGKSPVAVAVVSSAAILFVVLYLAHGVSLRTSSALLGTLMSLVMAGVLSWLAIETMHLTGLSGDQTVNLQVYQSSISISGLLLAGFIIGTLGVLNDVTITQASAAFELAAAGEPTRLATFRAAMRVGRDHIASTVYTLVFAYAGSALPLLLLFSVAQQPFGSLVTTDALAVELARSFVGGIAIALSVPLTTVIAAALARPAGAAPIGTESSASSPPAASPPSGGRHSRPDA
ncbi:MAG: YibE/F family protein [Actinomycetota bacterium]|nr:YibE/F family protein [Actinomycetota bacterium]